MALERVSKRFLPLGREAQFRGDVRIALSDLAPCKTDVQFKNILKGLEYTRHLQVRVLDTARGTRFFKELLERVEHLALESFRVVGHLNAKSSELLVALLADPSKGAKLRSKLRAIRLPMRPMADTARLQVAAFVQTGGPIDPRLETFDCTASLRYQSDEIKDEGHVFSLPREITVSGWHDYSTATTYGTPHSMAKQLIEAIALEPDEIDSLSLVGTWEDFRTNPNLQTYANPFVGFGLHSATNPLRLIELVLRDFCLFQVSDAMLTSIELASLQKLVLFQCTELPAFLAHLMAVREQLRIEVLEVGSYNRPEPLYAGDAHSLECFLECFCTLRTFKVEICERWEDKFDVSCLQSHKQLETCLLSLGRVDWGWRKALEFERPYETAACIATLRRNHADLKSLSFRWDEMVDALDSRWTAETTRAFTMFAEEAVEFKMLEHLEIICNDTCKKRLKYQFVKVFARKIHGYLVEASKGPCKINKISLRIRNAFLKQRELDRGQVGKSFIYDFGS